MNCVSCIFFIEAVFFRRRNNMAKFISYMRSEREESRR